ncbi:MAG TPA: S41 family peptidase [Gemmataceae bacterium]|nr:S41 family peptidase [Gemmataceae bacterium]
MTRWNLAWLVGIPLVVLLGLTLTYSAPLRPKDQNYELVKLVVEVLDEVDQNYVRDLDPAARRRLVEDMVNGGLERLDPYSGFMNDHEYRQFERKNEGSFGGIGIQVGMDRTTGALVVTTPLVGTPAFEAGILAGDQIVKIDGKHLDNLRTNEAIELIQGDVGKPVTLTVVHEGQKKPVDITVTRAIIKIESVLGDHRKPDNPAEWDFVIDKDKKIAYIRLLEFEKPTADTLQQVLSQLEGEGVRGLVLDLRGNPGGLLTSAVAVCDLFLTSGRIVSTQGRKVPERVYDAKPEGTLFEPAATHPIAVLVDRYSASASEIVAAALQDHGRAVIVGERTFGKGSVQNVYPMDEHTALKLTTQRYFRPSGKNIHRFPDSKESDEWGVSPNPGFEVKLTDEERYQFLVARRKRDVIHGKPGAAPPEDKKDGKTPPFVDKMLDRALEYLRGELGKNKA